MAARTESESSDGTPILHDPMLQFEFKKFKNALDDDLVYEPNNSEKDRKLIAKTAQEVSRGDLPMGSEQFRKVMADSKGHNSDDISVFEEESDTSKTVSDKQCTSYVDEFNDQKNDKDFNQMDSGSS